MNDFSKQLNNARKLYKSGNFFKARQIATKILKNTNVSSTDKNAAEELIKSMGMDPLVLVAFVLTTSTLVFLVLRYLF